MKCTRAFVGSALMLIAIWLVISSSPARAAGSGEAQIRKLYGPWAAAFNAKDTDAIMKFYAPGEALLVFDVVPPLQYVGADAYRKDWQDFFGGYKTVKVEVEQLGVVSDGKLAFTHSIQRVTGTDLHGKPIDVTLRVTDCLKKIKGKWLIVHEHVSAPINLETGKAELALKP
jgi:uncharacterized protein (TIGR02246 family)